MCVLVCVCVCVCVCVSVCVCVLTSGSPLFPAGAGSSSSNNERQGEEGSSSVLCFTTTCPPGPSSRPPGPSPDHLATVQTTTRTRSDPALGQAEVTPENGALLKAGSTRRECPALLWPGFLSCQKVIHFYSAKLTHSNPISSHCRRKWASRVEGLLVYAEWNAPFFFFVTFLTEVY